MDTVTDVDVLEPRLCTDHCPIETTVSIIGGRWKSLIMYHLHDGPKRFNEMRRLIPGVTQRMLTAHLRELERDGIIHRQVFAVVPPRVDYSLTDLGRSLRPILEAMAQWGEDYERMSRRRAA